MKKAFMIMAVLAMVFATGCHKDPENGGNNGGNAVTYTVTFNANGGSGTMQPQTFAEGETKALTANAFTYQYHTFVNWNTLADGTGTTYPDTQQVALTQNLSLYAQWKPLNGELNGHEWVDLGLPSGKLWATCNIGASSPTDYGDYFAWGEITPKADNAINWIGYKYANGDGNKLTKYCNDSSYGDNGYTDTLTVLLPEDDAATANWGAGWRMPTKAEMQELFNNTTVTWTTQNGINGHLFTASNGNSLFLPAAGRRAGGLYYDGLVGYYWLSLLNTIGPDSAWYFHFGSGGGGVDSDYYRFNGFSVRPICTAQN